MADSPAEAADVAGALLGTRLVTAQTGPEGVPVNCVLIEETLDISQEMYLAILVDGGTGLPIVMASAAGGIEIEKVAEESPEKIFREVVDSAVGLMPYQARKLSAGLGLNGDSIKGFATNLASLHRTFMENDCSLTEINPLVVTGSGKVFAADAKVDLDDDALFRHPELSKLYDPTQDQPIEVTARENDLSYVKLDGDVGCLVNGAGLAMATMDVAVAANAAPANFLDVGGGANEEKVAKAMAILLSDPGVRRVLVNIFGGILRCDVVARGILLAAEKSETSLPPIVVRMLGTNADEGRNILATSDLKVVIVDDFAGVTDAIRDMG
jgi:succinyl-CoA synthetase beta subunit